MTLIPDKYTFTIWQGATFFEVLTLYETSNTSTPRDLTGYSAEMVIRNKPNGTPLKINGTDAILSTSNSRIILGGTAGTITLKIAASDTTPTAITWKTGVYDLTITSPASTGNPNGVTDALLYGGIKVNGV